MDAHYIFGTFAALYRVVMETGAPVNIRQKTLRYFLGVFFICINFTSFFLPHPYFSPFNQPALLHALHSFYREFALHGVGASGMRFQINQFYRPAHTGIFCADAFIMLVHPPLGVCRPACIEGSICAFEDVTITDHLFLFGPPAYKAA